MSDAYDSETYNKCLDDHERTISAALNGETPLVFYSAYETNQETGNPINNLDEVAIKGKCVLYAKADEFWNGGNGTDYHSAVLENPTWLDVAVYANAMIQVTGDLHHVFLEGMVATGIKNMDDIPFYEFSMGS